MFIHDPERGSVYGDAVIWCWIDPRWHFLRITNSYAISWLVLAILWKYLLMVQVVYLGSVSNIYRLSYQNLQKTTRRSPSDLEQQSCSLHLVQWRVLHIVFDHLGPSIRLSSLDRDSSWPGRFIYSGGLRSVRLEPDGVLEQ